jgi:hypothetical protein
MLYVFLSEYKCTYMYMYTFRQKHNKCFLYKLLYILYYSIYTEYTVYIKNICCVFDGTYTYTCMYTYTLI